MKPEIERDMTYRCLGNCIYAITKSINEKCLVDSYDKNEEGEQEKTLEKEEEKVELKEREKLERVKLSESVSSIRLNQILEKKKDLSAPLITCDIGGTHFSRSLLDSGASVNLMPKALYNKFKFEDIESVLLNLQLVDGSIKQPYGVLEDVMIKLEHYTFYVDFIVTNMKILDNWSRTLIILRRPFLATTKAI
ncbi:unnamed protein product [Spirodela intermedia]|uniref:Uncharacterized protein n=1 Tax=Spirodela intermedia TaxID=51605 RepID=A0A7I8KWI6_SPIIN|nr:unnamed protein product [Spirodela intermedia]